MFYVHIWRPGAQDAENGRQRRSHLESILNVAQRLRLRCFHRLRPCWTAFLSILRGAKEQYGVPMEPELSDAKKKLFVWVLGSEPDDDRVIPLPRGPRVHIIGQAPGHQPP